MAPACLSGNAYIYLNDKGSDDCSLGDLTMKDMFFIEAGLGSVDNAEIQMQGWNQLVLSALVPGDSAETNGISLSFLVEGVTNSFSRTVSFAGACTHDPEEGTSHRSLTISTKFLSLQVY